MVISSCHQERCLKVESCESASFTNVLSQTKSMEKLCLFRIQSCSQDVQTSDGRKVSLPAICFCRAYEWSGAVEIIMMSIHWLVDVDGCLLLSSSFLWVPIQKMMTIGNQTMHAAPSCCKAPARLNIMGLSSYTSKNYQNQPRLLLRHFTTVRPNRLERFHDIPGNMQGPLPLTVTGKVQYISTSVMGTLPRAARELSKFPDLQEKAKHEYERFKNWVVVSGAEDYDHENYLNNLEHRVEYQQINDLLQRLHVFSYDGKGAGQ